MSSAPYLDLFFSWMWKSGDGYWWGKSSGFDNWVSQTQRDGLSCILFLPSRSTTATAWDGYRSDVINTSTVSILIGTLNDALPYFNGMYKQLHQ